MKEEYLSIDTITRLVELEKENKELKEQIEMLNKVANERMQTILEIEDSLDEYLTSEFRFEGDSYDKGACAIIDNVSNIINELKGENNV